MPSITGYTGSINTGPGTIDFGVHPTVEITQVQPYIKTFDIRLPAGEYQLTAAALHGSSSLLCDYDDELSIFVQYEELTGILIENEAVGGLRIKRTTIHDGLDISKNIVQEYDYKTANNPSKSSGVGMRPTKFQTKNTTYDFTGMNSVSSQSGSFIHKCEQFTTIKFSESQLPLQGVSGTHIAYKEVTVLDGVNGTNGKIRNKFQVVKNSDAYLYKDLSVPVTILDWRGGLLLEQIVYKKEQGSFLKLQETINDYEVASIDGDNSMHTFYGMKVGRIANLSTKTLTNSMGYIYCDAYNSNPANYPGISYQAGQTATAALADFFAFLIVSPVPFSLFVDLLAQQNPTSYIPHPCESYNNGDYLISFPSFTEYTSVRYPIFSGWNKLTKSTTRQYDENGVDYVETVTENEYDNVYTHT